MKVKPNIRVGQRGKTYPTTVANRVVKGAASGDVMNGNPVKTTGGRCAGY
jgi:hypothetical protein